MNTRLVFVLSSIVLAACLLALASDVTLYLTHIAVAPRLKAVLDVLAFAWPLALLVFGTYLRKVRAGAAEVRTPSA